MANRPFVPGGIAVLDTEVVKLFGSVVFGATSTVTSQSSNGFTVTALGTGTFTITCGDGTNVDFYNELLAIQMTPLLASAGDTGWQLITQSPSTGVFTIRNAPGGVATAPATSSILYIELTLRNSGTPRKGA